MERVFISSIDIKARDVDSLTDVEAILAGKKFPVLEKVILAGEEISIGELSFDPQRKYYPTRSNEKVMRKEVVAAFISISELMESSGITREQLMELPLFMASGICIEKQQDDLDWFAKAFRASVESESIAVKNKKLTAIIPPLLALRTLTNSAESFVAEASKVSGVNTTFGNTSISTYYAIHEAFQSIGREETNLAIVGGTNRGGVVSYLMYKNFVPDPSGWRDSTCTGFMLLESEKNMNDNNRSPIGEVLFLEHSHAIPSLTKTAPNGFSMVHISDESDAILHSGAFCEKDFQIEKESLSKYGKTTFSFFPSLGNIGTGSLLLSIAGALAFSREHSFAQVDCVDRDPFGRESLIRIKAL